MCVRVCVCVSNQRYSTDLDEKMSFLQISILQLIRFVGVIQRTDQLIHLQQIVLTWGETHRQNVRTLTPPTPAPSIVTSCLSSTDPSAAAWRPPGCVRRWTWFGGVPAGCRDAALGPPAPRLYSGTRGWKEPWLPEFGSAARSPLRTGS